MYRKMLVFAALLLATYADAVTGQGSSTWLHFSDTYAEDSSPTISLSRSHGDSFTIEIEIPGVRLHDRSENREEFVSMDIPPLDRTVASRMVVTSTSEVGRASLPVFRAFIAIPENVEIIQPEVTASSSYVLEDVLVYSVGKPVERNGRICEEFAMDDSFYSSDALYPPLIARAFAPSHLRDTRLVCLEICPFQYNPAKRQVTCHWRMQLRIQLGSALPGSGVLPDVYGKMLLNYPPPPLRAPAMENIREEGDVYYPANLSKNSSADYLIIAPDIFYEHKKIRELASWRAEYNGFDVAVVKTSDIQQQFGAGEVGIRDFIGHVYDLWIAPKSSDRHVAYVLLIGDVEHIPVHISNNNRVFQGEKIDTATDNWYACVSGEDSIPDVMLGRLPVKDTDELNTVVDKIIQYERNPRRGEWIERALLIAGTTNNVLYNLEYTRDEILLPAGYSVTELSISAGVNYRDVIREINRGHIIVDYTGHGFRNGWEMFRSNQIPKLNNRDMLPVIFNMACSTAAFDDEADCFGEVMLKAPGGGCVAFFGASRLVSASDIAFSLSRAMVQNHLFVLGEIVINVKLLNTLSKHDIESYNLLGDPALSLYAPRRDYYKKPDLAISPADITFVAEEFLPHSLVEIKAVVHNIGEVGAENVVVEFFRDGDTRQLIGMREIDYIPPQGESEVSILWQTPRGKAGNKILVEVHPVDGEEHSYDNHAVKTLWISIEAENFPVALDSAISSRTSWASAPILSDLDGDGDMESVVQGELSGSSYFYICAWHHDGALMEGFPVSILAANRYRKEKVELFPAVGDVDSDGFAEIACTFRTKKVYLLHHDGRVAEGFPVQLRAFAASSPVLYDIDGDGRLEIIVALTNGEIDVIRGDGTQLDGFPVFIHSGSETAFVPPTVAVGDVDGDGQPEIVVSLLQLDGSLGEYVILEHDGRVGSSMIEVPYTSLFPPSLGDINNDGHAEIVVVSEEKNVYVLNHKGILIAGFPTRTKSEIMSSPVLGDIDGDGSLEIATTTLDHVYAWHNDGTHVNGFPIYVRGRNSYPLLVDIDGDGKSEIIFSNNGIRAYHHDGSPVDGFPIKLDNSKMSAPALADVDGDGYLEISVTTNREIHLMDDAGIYSPKHIEWGAALHDTRNTNSHNAEIALRMPGIYLDFMQRNGSIMLSWRKEFDQTDVSFYRILRADFPTGPFSTLAKVGRSRSTYVDDTATVGVVYWYRIIAENGAKAPVVSNIVRACLVSSGQVLKDVCNYPNPAPSGEHPDSTIFSYYVAEDAEVRISIYSIIGQLVDEIKHDARGGIHNEVEWNISPIASGIYFYVVKVIVESGESMYRNGKLVVIK